MARGSNIGGMLAQSGLAGGQNIAQAYQQLGRGVGGMFSGVAGALERRQERRRAQSAQEQFQQILGANENNPEELMKQGLLAKNSPDPNLQRMGDLLIAQAGVVRENLKQTQQAASMQSLQQAISDTAMKLNLPDIAERALVTTDEESLRAIQKDLRALEIKDVVRTRGEPGRKALAKRYGITYEPYMADLTDDNFMKILEGQEAELKSFILPDGTETLLEVNKKDGTVRDPVSGTFRRASELNIRRAPNRSQVESIANYTSEKLAEAGVKRYDELATSADDATKVINNITEVMPNVDQMITGKLANAEVFVRSARSAIAAAVGLDPSDPKLENTQTFAALAAPRVATIIKDYGAGTGLSDADREFATIAAGGDITNTANALKNILRIIKDDAERTLTLFDDVTADIRESGNDPLVFYRIPALKAAPTLQQPTGVTDPDIPALPAGATLD